MFSVLIVCLRENIWGRVGLINHVTENIIPAVDFFLIPSPFKPCHNHHLILLSPWPPREFCYCVNVLLDLHLLTHQVPGGGDSIYQSG